MSSVNSFIERHYLPSTLIISLLVGFSIFSIVLILDPYIFKLSQSVKFSVLYSSFVAPVAFVIIFTWPRWFFQRLGKFVSSAVDALGDEHEKSEKTFRQGISKTFGPEVVDSIISYEKYCKNEYLLDMQKHHFAWILIAISGMVTLAATIFVLAPTSSPDGKLAITNVLVAALPATFTGVLLKIWLETRHNLKKTRERTDAIYRQKIRLLFLSSGKKEGREFDLSEAIRLNTSLLGYIRLDTEASLDGINNGMDSERSAG